MDESLYALFGGMAIGASAIVVLLFNGRIAGISGILKGAIWGDVKENLWRVYFLIGMLLGGWLLSLFYPNAFEDVSHLSTLNVAIAGVLVGFGTLLGNGCTSGHGICGVSRFSLRSLMATASFMFAGFVTVYILRHVV